MMEPCIVRIHILLLFLLYCSVNSEYTVLKKRRIKSNNKRTSSPRQLYDVSHSNNIQLSSLFVSHRILEDNTDGEVVDTPSPSTNSDDSQLIYIACEGLLKNFTNGASDESDLCTGISNFYNDLCLTNQFVWPKDLDIDQPRNFRRRCCSSLSLKYENECDEDETVSDSGLAGAATFFLICIIVRSMIRKYNVKWLPEVGGVTLVGAVIGLVADRCYDYKFESFDDAIFMRILLPPIIFDAALSVDKRRFRQHLGPILMLAFPGTLVCSFVTGGIVYGLIYGFSKYCEEIPFLECLIWGSLISSIDPVATIGALSDNGLTHDDLVFILIFGESLLNDGVAVVLTEVLSDYLSDSVSIGSKEIFEAIFRFAVVTLGSLSIGLISGAAATLFFWLMHGSLSALMEVLAFFLWALLPFWICDGIGWSGIVSIVATAFVIDIYVVGSLGTLNTNDTDDESIDDSTTYDVSRVEQLSIARIHHIQHNVTYSSQLHLRHAIRSVEPTLATQNFSFKRPVFSKEGLLTGTARYHVGFITEVIASLTEMMIFLYLGIYLFSPDYHWNGYYVIAAVIASVTARGITVSLVHIIYIYNLNLWLQCRCPRWFKKLSVGQIDENGTINATGPIVDLSVVHERCSSNPIEEREKRGMFNIDRKIALMLWIAGLRGAMSLALVEEIPLYDFITGEGTTYKPELKAMTSAAICFTIFIFGGGTQYALEYLKIGPVGNSNQTNQLSLNRSNDHNRTNRTLNIAQTSSISEEPLLSEYGPLNNSRTERIKRMNSSSTLMMQGIQ